MIQNLAAESKMISDSEFKDNAPEMPVVVENYPLSDGIQLTTWDGQSVYIPWRMVKEVTKVMIEFSTPKKKSK